MLRYSLIARCDYPSRSITIYERDTRTHKERIVREAIGAIDAIRYIHGCLGTHEIGVLCADELILMAEEEMHDMLEEVLIHD